MRTRIRFFTFCVILLFILSPKDIFSKTYSIDKISVTDDTLNINGKVKSMHVGWQKGRLPEFSNAYTLQRHEFRLNVLGRSSFACSNRFEISSYLPLIICPNISFKYKFIDKAWFASALEAGTAGGIFPVAAAGGIILPGAAAGAATIGLLHGSDNHVKLFLSVRASNKLTFSVRASASTIKVGYWGIGGFAGVGGGGAVVGILPLVLSKRFTWLSGGFETDYLINEKNVIVFNTSLGGFEGGRKQLGLTTLAWTHAKIHFHYSVGLYTFLDPPAWEIIKNSKLPVSVFANVYWIFNNGKNI